MKFIRMVYVPRHVLVGGVPPPTKGPMVDPPKVSKNLIFWSKSQIFGTFCVKRYQNLIESSPIGGGGGGTPPIYPNRGGLSKQYIIRRMGRPPQTWQLVLGSKKRRGPETLFTNGCPITIRKSVGTPPKMSKK